MTAGLYSSLAVLVLFCACDSSQKASSRTEPQNDASGNTVTSDANSACTSGSNSCSKDDCDSDTDCSGTYKHCDQGHCVECKTSLNCSFGLECVEGGCQSVKGCASDVTGVFCWACTRDFCLGNREIAICQEDGTLGESKFCDERTEGWCVLGECCLTHGQKKCVGNTVHSCPEKDGTIPPDVECADTEACIDGECVEKICEPNQPTCFADSLVYCNETGTRYVGRAEGCPYRCEDGKCVSLRPAGAADAGANP